MSWKDSSDFASLAAALSRAKKPIKSNEAPKKEFKEELTSSGVEETLNLLNNDAEVEPKLPKYSDFCKPLNLPLTDSVTLKQHKSTVSALEFESSGSRFLSGSHDTTVAYWDFNGMVKDHPAPFRYIEPMGSHSVKLKFIIEISLLMIILF